MVSGSVWGVAQADVFDFSKGEQGFVASIAGTGATTSPFVYADGRWAADGAEAGSDQFTQAILTSPVVTLGGEVFVRVTHRYEFETDWDGAHLLISLNGGPDQVAGEEIGIFFENEYSRTISDQSSNPRSGSRAWSGASGDRVTSLVSLGNLPAGSTVQTKLVATWDAGTVAPTPNWEVFEVAIVDGEDYRTWVVDNNPENVTADFRGIDEAIEAAGPGDVLLVMPSSINYSNAKIDKRLTIVGPGFGGPELGARFRPLTAMFSDIDIELGVRGVTLMGLDVSGAVTFQGAIIEGQFRGVSNVLLLRNRIGTLSVSAKGFLSNAFFINNWIVGEINLVSAFDFTRSFGLRSAFFFNNVIRGGVDLYQAWTTGGFTSNRIESVSQVVFANNVFDGSDETFDMRHGEFYNNIVHRETDSNGEAVRFSPREVQVDHNVFFGTLPSSVSSEINTFVKPASEVLRWDDSHWFQKFELAENSPAATAGRDSSEAGIFGGLYPWDRDQAPPVPFVTNIEAPLIVGQGEGMTFRVEVKSNQ